MTLDKHRETTAFALKLREFQNSIGLAKAYRQSGVLSPRNRRHLELQGAMRRDPAIPSECLTSQTRCLDYDPLYSSPLRTAQTTISCLVLASSLSLMP